ncbi:hypothetical protein RF11_14353 [Thelohanellus kitauei]|uniref:Uncharacterized protein n=1 Tax=Thelohanellus kitauei TaxID=669202 RepID=A0A0C2JAA0_THEKT|nr:hypothetical protein RF11_11592 [Thelohanellus kitauei]KII74724.1 hypothetical protein RF11_14353 [Thelohanellus kitauei]
MNSSKSNAGKLPNGVPQQKLEPLPMDEEPEMDNIDIFDSFMKETTNLMSMFSDLLRERIEYENDWSQKVTEHMNRSQDIEDRFVNEKKGIVKRVTEILEILQDQ